MRLCLPVVCCVADVLLLHALIRSAQRVDLFVPVLLRLAIIAKCVPHALIVGR
jgi:hypothetical protein